MGGGEGGRLRIANPSHHPFPVLACPGKRCLRVKSNGRDTIMISSLPVLHVVLQGGRNAAVVCPSCGTWQTARGGLVQVHATDGNKKTRGNIDRCPGSGQHLTFDRTEAQHAKARAAEVQARRRQIAAKPASTTAAQLRRPTTVHALVYPSAVPAVHQIAVTIPARDRTPWHTQMKTCRCAEHKLLRTTLACLNSPAGQLAAPRRREVVLAAV